MFLKDFVSQGRKVDINRKTNELEFETTSIRLPIDTATAWKRRDGKGFYSLGSLWLILHMKDAKGSDYSREANKLNIPLVVFTDKKEIVDYFSGLLRESSMIQASVRAQTLLRKADIKSGKVL